MRKNTWAVLLVALTAALGTGSAVADHFDGDGGTGTFNPQVALTLSSNVVNRPSSVTWDITQTDHEDPPVYAWLRSPAEWQYNFAALRPAENANNLPAANCEETLNDHGNSPNGTGWGVQRDYSKRSDGYVARAEKIGTSILRLHANGITRPGNPAQWNGDVVFLRYAPAVAADPSATPPIVGSPATARLCLFFVTTDTRVTELPDTNPDPSDTEDDIESATELVAEFDMVLQSSGWEVYSDLSDTFKDAIYQAPNPNDPPEPGEISGLELSLIQLQVATFGTTPGNWDSAEVFSKTPQVSGTRNFEAAFRTCPAAGDTSWGSCVSGRPDVTRTHARTTILPAPALTAPGAGSTDNDGLVTVGGTSDPLASVQVFDGASPIGSAATADATGVWSTDVSFSEGSHTVTARTVDAGGQSAASNSRTFNVDVPPASPAVSQPSNGAVVGAGPITVSGGGQPGSTTKVYEGATLLSTAATNQAGAWSTTVIIDAKGPHTLTATSTDAGGASGPTPFMFDVTTAVPIIATPAQGGAFPANDVTLSGSAEPDSTVTVFEEGTEIATAVADGNGAWSVVEPFAEGTHTITATATGLDLLVSPSTQPRRFAVDLTVPDAPVILTPLENADAGSATLTITGSSEPYATIILSENGVPFAQGPANGSGSWSIPAQLSIAQHTVTATAKDLAGNVGLPSAPRTFNVVQSILIVTPDENGYAPRVVKVSGQSDPASTQVLVFEGATQRGTANVVNGSWTMNITLPEGPHTLTANSVTGGVLSPASTPRSFKVDGTAPALNVAQPSNGDLAILLPGDKISGTATDGGSGVKSIVISYFNSLGQFVRNQNAVCTGCTGASVTWEALPIVSPGVYGVQIRVSDGVNNGSMIQRTIVVL